MTDTRDRALESALMEVGIKGRAVLDADGVGVTFVPNMDPMDPILALWTYRASVILAAPDDVGICYECWFPVRYQVDYEDCEHPSDWAALPDPPPR